MNLFKNLFASREKQIRELREKIICIRHHQTLMAKRFSYIESRHPELFKHLMNKDNPIARLRPAEKERIAKEIDSWLDELK